MAIGRPFNRTIIKRATCLIDSSLIRIKRWNGFLSAECLCKVPSERGENGERHGLKGQSGAGHPRG